MTRHLSLLSSVVLLLLLLSLLLRVLSLLLLLIERLLLLSRNLLVELVILLILVVLLEILERVLPDASQSSSGISSDGAPSGLCAKQLDALGLGGERAVDGGSGTGDAVELSDVLECVVAENVLGDQRAAVEDHDGLRLLCAAVGDDGGLREDALLELVAAAVVDCDLDFLDNEHDGRLFLELILEVGLAEQVVQIVVEAVVDLINY